MACPVCGVEPRFAWDSLEYVCPVCNVVVDEVVYDYGETPRTVQDPKPGQQDRVGFHAIRPEDLQPGVISSEYYSRLGSTYDPYEGTGNKGPKWAARQRRVDQVAYWTKEEKRRARFHREVREGPYRDYIESFPEPVVFKFERIYPEAMGHLRGVPQSYAVPAVLQLASALRGHELPLTQTIEDAAELGTDADRSATRYVRTLVKLQRILGTEVSLLDLFPDAVEQVDPAPIVLERARSLMVPVAEDTTPKRLATRAAATLYCAGREVGQAPTQQALADAFDISRPTLRKEVRRICPEDT